MAAVSTAFGMIMLRKLKPVPVHVVILWFSITTSISAFVIGGGVYILGVADVAYKLSFTESFAFGSLISAGKPTFLRSYFADF